MHPTKLSITFYWTRMFPECRLLPQSNISSRMIDLMVARQQKDISRVCASGLPEQRCSQKDFVFIFKSRPNYKRAAPLFTRRRSWNASFILSSIDVEGCERTKGDRNGTFLRHCCKWIQIKIVSIMHRPLHLLLIDIRRWNRNGKGFNWNSSA